MSQRETSSVTNILVTKQTREILRQLGTKRQTYDEIIQKILENSTYKNVLGPRLT
jgi:flagellar biosynthesis chaperone FliJ